MQKQKKLAQNVIYNKLLNFALKLKYHWYVLEGIGYIHFQFYLVIAKL